MDARTVTLSPARLVTVEVDEATGVERATFEVGDPARGPTWRLAAPTDCVYGLAWPAEVGTVLALEYTVGSEVAGRRCAYQSVRVLGSAT